MRLLELFAGTKSIGEVAKRRGWEVYSSDIMPEFETDQTSDIFDFDIAKMPWLPDAIWASPPCTTFSVASIGAHWTGGHRAYEPKTHEAIVGMQIVQHTLNLIGELAPEVWWVENPTGVLRKLPLMYLLPRRVEITYCQYGDTRMKPTDIWTNDLAWVPRQKCSPGDPCHEAAPRGSKTGTQGLAKLDRSRVPEELCTEVLQSAEEML